MKNLKKVLSLVLALAMALSLMTVAFAKDASDFADYSKVDFNEAVDVMVAAGVFDGVENNNFDPTAVLTREQAAKIVTYMIIGADAADKLTTTVAPYADVAANRWSAGAIAWCTERGILAGSNGKFNPTGELTGLAFSKMLLVALGYDAEIEKLVGSSWAINAATLAIENDLDDGLETIALSSVLTREQACQMAFNTMKADLVKYESKGTNITLSDGTNVVVGASSAAPYFDRTATTALGTPAITQFAEKYCQKLRLEGTSNDAFGRPATEWSYNGSSIGTYAKSATTSYEGTVTKGTLYSLLGSSIADKTEYYEGTDTAKPYKLTVWVDGVKQVVNASDYLASGSSATAGATAKGATTEVFVDSDAKTITVAIVNTYVAQAAADYSTANKSLAIDSLSAGPIGTKISKDDFDVTGYVEDDYILYTYDKNAGKVKSIEKAEVVTGTVGTYVKGSSGYVTLGGTKYSYSANVASYNGGNNASYAVGEEATVVLDKQGNVIVVDALAAVNENYVFVQSVGSGDARDTYVIADLTSIEGKESTATLKQITIDGREKKTVSEMKTAMPKDAAGWFTYTISSDKYKLSADTSKQYYAVATSGEKLVENGSITIGKSSGSAVAGKANSKTVFVIKDADDNVTVYEGIAKVPTITASSDTYAYYYNGDDNYAKYVYIDVEAVEGNTTATIDDKTASNDDVFYILKQSDKVVAADDNEYYTLDVLKNGEVVKLDVETGANKLADSEGKIVYKLKVNSKNQGASATEIAGDLRTCRLVDSMSNYYVSYSNNVLNLKNSSSDKYNLVLADDAVIYVVLKDANLMADPAADYEVQTLTAKQLAGFLNGRTVTGAVTGITTSSDSYTYKTIYMTITNSVEF